MVHNLLDQINIAQDVRDLPRESLPQLCSEVRDCLIDTVSKNAGHLASGLGVVELTVALHYVFNTPQDKLIWDVGHQAYPHKILTGHREEFATIRQKNGLHAFIWRNETPYDLISTGHASTSIGSALGLAIAESKKPKEERAKVIAIIGDGALSGGCAFEALNHAGSLEEIDLTVILNDNEMSITKNVGSMAQGLSHVISSPHYVKLVEGGKRILNSLPSVKNLAMRAQEHVKGMLMPGTLFEEFGFNYIGPIDGHDISRLVSILQNIRDMSGLNFLHVVTKKGKGYAPAEEDPVCYHGVPCFNPEKGLPHSSPKEDLSYSAAFGRWMCDRASKDDKLMAITPAMRIGAGLDKFAEKFPKQFIDVAIAEQHAMVLASGLAAGGLRPVVNIYSSFMQRAYDGLIHDMAIQDLPIILTIDRGGLVGPDGPTHNGSFDIAYTRTVPNLVIMAPSSRYELYRMLNLAYQYNKPVVIRYPRANGESLLSENLGQELSLEEQVPLGKAECLYLNSLHQQKLAQELNSELKAKALHKLNLDSEQFSLFTKDLQNSGERCLKQYLTSCSSSIAVLAFGPFAQDLKQVASTEDFSLFNMRFIKPLDEELIKHVAQEYDLIVTVEEGASLGGIGEQVASIVAKMPLRSKACVFNLGLPDRFLMEATRTELLADEKLDVQGICSQIAEFVKNMQN